MQTTTRLITEVEQMRLEVRSTRERILKSELGQFFTSSRIAYFMAEMIEINRPHIRLLDPGAGIGILTAAFVERICNQNQRPQSLDVVAVEVDETIIPFLAQALEICKEMCQSVDIKFSYQILNHDFLEYGAKLIREQSDLQFNAVIMNPPYKKIQTKSKSCQILRDIGVETSNLYAAFVAVAKRLLVDSGQLVAITPRSFCNGTYFRNFRFDFLTDMTFKRIHLFESRKRAFSSDDVLQENIIYLAEKNVVSRATVRISTSIDVDDPVTTSQLNYNELIESTDDEKFIRIIKNNTDLQVKSTLGRVTSTLDQLNLKVSTGKIVDFRTTKHIRSELLEDTKPLIYPFHFTNGYVRWPAPAAEKPDSIVLNDETKKMLVPNGNYVLVRRFSSKEEAKRIKIAIFNQLHFNVDFVGFENHVNYFHINNEGLPLLFATGLSLYLSSTLVDRYFRQFNGHTQVNVGDLKSLPYPTYDELIEMGQCVGDVFPEQHEIDIIVSRIIGIQ